MSHVSNSTSSASSDSTPKVINLSILNAAFVEPKNSKKAQPDTNAVTAADVDIRKWPADYRQLLIKGQQIKIFIGSKLIVEITKPLLRSTSTNVDNILKDGQVHLPEHLEAGALVRLIHYLRLVAKSAGKPPKCSATKNWMLDLGVCVAAKHLGMEKYVDHLFGFCFAQAMATIPSYEQITATTHYASDYPRLFNAVTQKLAEIVWNDTVPDPEDWKAYLKENTKIAQAITTANQKHANWLRKQEIEEERKRQQEKAAEREAAFAKKREEQEKKDKVYWAEKREKEAALEKSVRDKVAGKGNKKFTAEEAIYWRKTRGCRVPAGHGF